MTGATHNRSGTGGNYFRAPVKNRSGRPAPARMRSNPQAGYALTAELLSPGKCHAMPADLGPALCPVGYRASRRAAIPAAEAERHPPANT